MIFPFSRRITQFAAFINSSLWAAMIVVRPSISFFSENMVSWADSASRLTVDWTDPEVRKKANPSLGITVGIDKVLAPLGELPVLAHTLYVFQDSPAVDEIVVVTREDLIVPIGPLCRDAGLSKVRKVIVGGATRTHSVLAGLGELPSGAELVAIHDGARPLVSQEVLETVIFRAAECGAAAPAVPVKDTIKRARDGLVEATLERSELFAVQTPQVFQVDLIKAALVKALEDGAALTDDCGAVERLGIGVSLTQGDYCNLKITTPEDLAVAEALFAWREQQ